MKQVIFGAIALSFSTSALAGGQLDTFRFTGQSTQIPGFEDVEVVPIFWDARCTNIVYTLDNISATGQSGKIRPPMLRRELRASFNRWNEIRTSFIRMDIKSIKRLGNGTRSFDFINELTFETPAGSGFLASSPSTVLQQDATFSAGDDIDGDGDSDVFDPAAAGKNSCFDSDKDGDIEFPAGDYLAGTILDNDVQFNDRLREFGFFFELNPSSTPPGAPRGIDIQAVAVHEFGHSHGLSHSVINQISDQDGTGSTMFPFIDIDEAASEAGTRTLHTDDSAWSSFVYPEGSAASGPAALQKNDQAFSSVYSVIAGELVQSGFGVLGGNVFARQTTTGRILGEAFSGFARGFSPDGFNVFIFDAATSVIDGDFEIPVPKSSSYELGIQALDGDPVATGNISLTAIIGGILGQHNYAAELYGAPGEDGVEFTPGDSSPVAAGATGIRVITNVDQLRRNAGSLTNIGTAAAIGAPDVIYAERFANSDVLSALGGGGVLTTGLFRTGVFDASIVGVFERAGLFYGRANSDGTASIDLASPLRAELNFVGEDGDLTPLYFSANQALSEQVESALKTDPTLDLFLVLEALNNPVVGDSGLPPLLGLAVEPATGNSYLSVAGGPFNQRTTSNWVIELRFTP